MKLQTTISIKKESKNLIDYYSKILLLGSCFSENIGNKFKEFQFQTTQNPFGILFHPKAIETLVARALNTKIFTKEDIINNNEMFHLFETHSNLSNTNQNKVLTKANSAIYQTKIAIENASQIIITLGTSWIYRHKDTNKIVANCHKIPQKEFDKELLSISEIINCLQSTIDAVLSVNSNVQFIFTVSPVRHIKDGFVENNVSKAHLLTSIHQIILDNKSVANYFPSYEIVMDELRDYRFYKEDLLHPNTTAINYIWEKFITTWFSSSTEKIMQKVTEINKGLSHKPFNGQSDAHQHFLKKIAKKQQELITKFPFMKW